MTENKADKKLTFEQAYKRLEKITRELENSDTPLEKAFGLFEEGQKLIRMCHQLLDRAGKRLEVLTEVDTGFEVKEELVD